MPLPEVGPTPYTLHTPGNIQNMDYSKLKVRDKGKNSNVKKIMSNKFVIHERQGGFAFRFDRFVDARRHMPRKVPPAGKSLPLGWQTSVFV